MKVLIPLVLIVTAASVSAQQAPGVGSVQPPLTQTRPDWKADVEAGTPSAARMGAVGASLRLTADSAAVVRRSGWTAQGRFQVRATIYRAPGSAATAAYGLTLGGSEAGDYVAFAVRADRAIAVQQHKAGAITPLQEWIPCVYVAPASANGSALDVLEVRVESTSATFLVNGHSVATIAIATGALDGAPGLHLGAGGDITVSALSVAGDSVRGRPGLAPVSK